MNRVLFLTLGLCMLTLGCTKEEGCTDISACNYSLTAETDDGTCFYQGDECDDEDDSTSNDTVNDFCICEGVDGGGGGNGGGGEDVSGCTDSAACNFDSSATSDDGSCVFEGDSCDDGNSNTINDVIVNCECVGEALTVGCTDATACNYNSSATSNDGSCVYPGDPCNDGNADTVNDAYNANCDCVGVEENTNQCAINDNGYVVLQYGIFADQYVDECNYQIYLASDPSVATPIQTVGVSYEWNYSEQEISGYGPWVMSVTDSYGDGKGGDDDNPYDGGYGVYCYSNTGDLINLVYTPFTDGSSSTTEFTLDVYGFQGENAMDN